MDHRSRAKTALSLVGLAVATGLFAAGAQAQEQRELSGMEVIGNQELPKALYIVPWQRSTSDGEIPPPDSLLAGQELGPLDPDIFRRELKYQEQLQQVQ